jgi:hypothetical protein
MGLSAGAIVGLVIGSVLFVLLLILIIWRFAESKKGLPTHHDRASEEKVKSKY